jgi:hypothetical protein
MSLEHIEAAESSTQAARQEIPKMTKALFPAAILCAAVLAIDIGPSDAQTSVQAYRYCSLDRSGATVCYFNDRAECAKAGSGPCIESPDYWSAYAMALEPGRSPRKHHRHP